MPRGDPIADKHCGNFNLGGSIADAWEFGSARIVAAITEGARA